MAKYISTRAIVFVIPLLAVSSLQLAGCGRSEGDHQGGASQSKTLTIFAAASLSESFRELGKQFEDIHPGVTVSFNFAGSQQLRGQIEQGAVADVFASANAREMDTLVTGKHVDASAVKLFSHNRLIIIFPKNNPGKITAIKDLVRPGLKIDIADPAVPVGKYTDTMLDLINRDAGYGPDFKSKFAANVVSREVDVNAVVSKVWLGEVDAGVVYVSDVTGQAGKELGSLPIPDNFNQIASYPIAVLDKAPQSASAREFIDLVLSPAGQAVLKMNGLEPVAPSKP